jgi:hypothetical protein
MNLRFALIAIGLNSSPTMQYGHRTTGSAIVASILAAEDFTPTDAHPRTIPLGVL